MAEAGVYELLPKNRKKLEKAIIDLMETIRKVTLSEADRLGIKDVRIILLYHQFTEKAIVALLKATHSLLEGVVEGLKQKESTGG